MLVTGLATVVWRGSSHTGQAQLQMHALAVGIDCSLSTPELLSWLCSTHCCSWSAVLVVLMSSPKLSLSYEH